MPKRGLAAVTCKGLELIRATAGVISVCAPRPAHAGGDSRLHLFAADPILCHSPA